MRELVCAGLQPTQGCKTHNHNPLKPIPMAEQSQLPPRTPKDQSSLESNIERVKQKFLAKLSSRGKDHPRNPKDTEKLLADFYRPGRADFDMIAQTRQKILVVKLAEANSAGLQNGDSIKVTYTLPNSLPPSTLNARVKRVSEYPNAIDEFQIPIPTLSLIHI